VLIRAKCKGATVGEVRARLLKGDTVSALVPITSSGTRLNALRSVQGVCTPRAIRWLKKRYHGLTKPFRRAKPGAPALLQ
jgi:hypothetical protein